MPGSNIFRDLVPRMQKSKAWIQGWWVSGQRKWTSSISYHKIVVSCANKILNNVTCTCFETDGTFWRDLAGILYFTTMTIQKELAVIVIPGSFCSISKNMDKTWASIKWTLSWPFPFLSGETLFSGFLWLWRVNSFTSPARQFETVKRLSKSNSSVLDLSS